MVPKKTLWTAALLSLSLVVPLAVGASGEADSAAADDADRTVAIELMQGAWVGTPRGDDDPYRKWLNETYNVEFTLNNTREFPSQVLVRFASDDVPDMISHYNKDLMVNLWREGVLVEDWNAYAGDVPTVLREMADLAKTALTFDGQLALLASPPNPAIWAWKVRTDWLANLGLEVPTTPEELLEVARKFTYDDPDGNGKDDTYAFTSAGNKAGVGEINNLLQMWAAEQTFGIKDNAVTHPIVSGEREQFLMLVRTIVSEKLIDPDWYTISWNDRKPALFAGKYGFAWYPGVLANESENGTGNTGKTIGWWQTMATPVGSERGGTIPDGSLWGIPRTVSAEAESDAVKMARILSIIEDTAYPNDGFWKLRWGVEIDGFVVNDAGDGWKFMNVQGQMGVNKRGYCDGCNLGLYDWGYSIGSRGDKLIEGSSDELAGATLAELEMNKAALRLPTYPRYDLLLSLDPTLVEELSVIQAEFDFRYTTGETSDYEGFRERWLAAGGQQLLDEAEAQFRNFGLIK